MLKRLLFSAFFLSTPALSQDAAPQAYQNLLTPLLQSGTDVLGTPIDYPDGAANVTAAIVTVPPGGQCIVTVSSRNRRGCLSSTVSNAVGIIQQRKAEVVHR